MASCCEIVAIGKWHSPLLPYITVCKINQFLKGCIRREHAFVFCHLTDLTVIPFNSICCIYELTNSRSVLEIFGQLIPILLPGPDNDRILFAPFFFQLKKFIFCRFFIYSLINAFQILQEFLLIFGTYIFDGITNLMYNTKLYGCIGINTLDCFRKTFQAVYTGYKNIFNSTVLEICRYTEPEVCSLIS